MDFKEFISMDEETRKKNIQESNKFFNNEFLKEAWGNFFNENRSV